ncbi:MAG: hypothetical protein HOI95_10055 [Chromatiales bacterium]|jgi:hypothetical protein|nr:hypothetical protein [Chromatiales bacterium]
MKKDQIAAAVIVAVAMTLMPNREPEPDDIDDRIMGVAFMYVLTMLWRLIAKFPGYGGGFTEPMASGYGRADLRVPVCMIIWGLFLFFVYSAAFL